MDAGYGIVLLIEACINFIICGFLNGLCAWVIHSNAHFVLSGFWNIFIDTTITCFLVSICTAFFSTASAKRYSMKGMRISADGKRAIPFDVLPAAALPAGCCQFGMCLPVLILLFGISFRMIGTDTLTVMQFTVFKGVWGGLYGAFICLVILFRHLSAGEKHV